MTFGRFKPAALCRAAMVPQLTGAEIATVARIYVLDLEGVAVETGEFRRLRSPLKFPPPPPHLFPPAQVWRPEVGLCRVQALYGRGLNGQTPQWQPARPRGVSEVEDMVEVRALGLARMGRCGPGRPQCRAGHSLLHGNRKHSIGNTGTWRRVSSSFKRALGETCSRMGSCRPIPGLGTPIPGLGPPSMLAVSGSSVVANLDRAKRVRYQ